MRRMTSALTAALVALPAGAAIAAVAPGPHPHPRPHHGPQHALHPAPHVLCTGDPRQAHRLDLIVGGVPTFGFYAVPQHQAKGIVVFDHGYGHTAYSWIEHAE